MASSFNGINVVDKRKKCFIKTFVVLQSNFHINIIFEIVKKDNRMERLFVGIKKFNKRNNAAFIMKCLFFGCAFIFNRDGHSFVQKCKFAHPRSKGFKGKLDCFKDFFVRMKNNSSSSI